MNRKLFHLPLITVISLLMFALGCGLGGDFGNLTLTEKETALNELPGESQIMSILTTNSEDLGIYWLDLDSHKIYLAKKLDTGMPPPKEMVTWTGSDLVYGSRVDGFFSLAPDGTSQQVTEFDYPGQLAKNGEKILRFKECAPDESGSSYTITPLDSFPEPPLICVPRHANSDKTAWYLLKPIWNPYLTKVDFVLSKRRGASDDLAIEWSKLIHVTASGEREEIIDLGEFYPSWIENDIQPRPDGNAFYLFNEETGNASIIDSQGATLVDFTTLDIQLPDLERTRRFSWSPDSQKAILFFESCPQGSDPCGRVIVLVDENFSQLREILTLPAEHRIQDIVWAPNGDQLGLITKIHQGIDDPPRIFIIDLRDASTTEYIFPTQFIVESVEWLR